MDEPSLEAIEKLIDTAQKVHEAYLQEYCKIHTTKVVE